MQGYLIDAAKRRIKPITFEYSEMRKWLPGGLCIGHVFSNGDVLYVDDEALLHPANRAFRIRKRLDRQPMMSDGLLTGRDSSNTTLPPGLTMQALAMEIEWMDLQDALAWFSARADEPAVVATDKHGHRSVMSYWGDFYRLMTTEE